MEILIVILFVFLYYFFYVLINYALVRSIDEGSKVIDQIFVEEKYD